MSTESPQSGRYYTVAEIALVIRCSPANVRQLCIEGKIPATKPAGTWLIPADEFAVWVKSGANEALGATA